MVLVGQGGTVLTISGLLLYSLLFDISIVAIYITTFFYTICSTFSGIAFSASIANLVDEERIKKRCPSINYRFPFRESVDSVGGMLFGFVSMEWFYSLISFHIL